MNDRSSHRSISLLWPASQVATGASPSMSAHSREHRPRVSNPEDLGIPAEIANVRLFVIVGELPRYPGLDLHTSLEMVRRASQSIRGRMLRMNSGWKSNSCCSSSASWKCNGNDAGDVLHSFTAHVTKLAVITFIVVVSGWFLMNYRREGFENAARVGRYWFRSRQETNLKDNEQRRWSLRGRKK